MIWGIYSALQGTGMPFPTPHRHKKQAIVTMVKPITSIAPLQTQLVHTMLTTVCTSLQVQHLAWHTPEFMQNGSGRRPLPFALFFY